MHIGTGRLGNTVMNFKEHYSRIFELFGYPLSESASVAESKISATEKALGVTIPPALRDYYSAAGNEKRFNQAHNRLTPVQGLELNKKRLVFMIENQCVVEWGVSIGNPLNHDPPVWQSPVSFDEDEEGSQWFHENRRCSVFLAVMLHYQAVSGGFKFCASAPLASHIKRKLKSGWVCYGTDSGMTAYSRHNQVVCLESEMGLLAGGKSKQDLAAIERDLEMELGPV
jgi:hypothetical protein